jgi:type IV secretion system protein VirB10
MAVEQTEGVSPHARPPVTGRQKIAIGITILAAIAAIVYVSQLLGPRHKAEKPEHTISSGMPFRAPAEPKPVERSLPLPMAAPSIPKIPAKATAPSKDDALDAPIFSTAGTSYEPGGAGRAGPGEAGEKKDKDDEFASMLRPSDIGAAAKAKRMRHPSLTVAAGTMIPCTLLTAIDSTLAGFVTCVTSAEVRSADGTISLLDKGSQLFGEVRSGLKRGADRIFVLWVRARTPENVIVSLDSPGDDDVGRSGISGNVNRHFWSRFGHALLFSVIEALPQLANTALQNRGSNNINTNFTQFFSPTQSLAGTVLREEIDIPDTIEVNQGKTLSVMVARDLDFSAVYDVKIKGPPASTCDGCRVPTWVTEKDAARMRQ